MLHIHLKVHPKQVIASRHVHHLKSALSIELLCLAAKLRTMAASSANKLTILVMPGQKTKQDSFPEERKVDFGSAGRSRAIRLSGQSMDEPVMSQREPSPLRFQLAGAARRTCCSCPYLSPEDYLGAVKPATGILGDLKYGSCVLRGQP